MQAGRTRRKLVCGKRTLRGALTLDSVQLSSPHSFNNDRYTNAIPMTKKEVIELYKQGTKALLKAHQNNRSTETDTAKIDKLDAECVQKVQELGSMFTKNVRLTMSKNGKLRLLF